MPMRVLITSPTYPPFNSGLGNAVQRQAMAIAADGFEVVVATGGPARQSGQDEASGAWIEHFNVSGADYAANPIRGDIASYEDFLLKSEFDVVLMNAWQNWATDLCLGLADRMAGRKLLLSHCLSTDAFFWHRPLRSLVRYLLWRPYRWRLPALLRRLDGMIVLSDSGCDSRFADVAVARRLGMRLAVIPNALSSPAVRYLGGESAAAKRCDRIIAVGSYDWQKGHDFVLRAYAASLARNRIPLRIFGQSFTPFTDRLRHLADDLHIDSEYVRFGEGVSGDALFEEIASARILVSGSHTECQPLVLLDSMAAGTPFVARSTGCIPALPGGLAVTSVAQAASAINELLAEESRWLGTSSAGMDAARRVFHPDVVGRALVGELRHVLEAAT